MLNDIRIDSHKLIYHPDAVARWLAGENIYPIEIEVGLTNACNHRCVFCAVDYTGYKASRLDAELLKENLRTLAARGLKSVIYAGEGEPLLHKNAPDIINATKSFGVDAALSTNGVLLTPEISEDCLKSLTWVRFSVGGISEETYSKIHRCKPADLSKVLANIEAAVKVRRDNNLNITLGVQLLLLPDNKDELTDMGIRLRELGVDYFTIKPFSQHPQSEQVLQVDYGEMLELEPKVKALDTEEFKVFFRAHSMRKLALDRPYKHCWALPFMVYIDARGNLWPCIVFMGKDDLKYGNLYENSFAAIWEGEYRQKIAEYFMSMDLNKNCREICRLDEMNKYLDELKHPGAHVNFI